MSLPCECSTESIEWVTDVEDFEFDGEYELQPGECDCGQTYYRRWDKISLTTEDGRIVEDYTERY